MFLVFKDMDGYDCLVRRDQVVAVIKSTDYDTSGAVSIHFIADNWPLLVKGSIDEIIKEIIAAGNG